MGNDYSRYTHYTMVTQFSFSASKEKMKRQYNLDINKDLHQSFNIGANQNAYILKSDSADLQVFRWGLIPSWAKDKEVGKNLINAQAEGIAGQLSFRFPVRQRRCVVFADSYYEWKKEPRNAQPYRVFLANGDLMAFAGVWDSWEDKDKKVYHTFSIISTTANEDLQKLGVIRMPVILEADEVQKWLADEPLPKLLDLLKPLKNNSLAYYPISKNVESLENNYPELHKPIELV